MKDTVELLKSLGDETRLRILQLLSLAELTVSDLEQILNLPQSRISSQLAKLRASFPFRERREGRKVWLALSATGELADLLKALEPGLRDARSFQLDRQALAEVLRRRREAERESQEKEPQGLGKDQLPGRSWEAFARGLLALIEPGRILDVGVGGGEMTLLFASRATQLHAVDHDPDCLQRLEMKASRRGVHNLLCHLAPAEALPLEDSSVDLAVMSQLLHLLEEPERAIREASRVLAPGGRLLIFDLLAHDETWVSEKLEHRHLGFSANELVAFGRSAGLVDMEAYPVARDPEPPRFRAILFVGRKAGTPQKRTEP